MPTLPSKQELKSMMYRDLQKICKDWGVRANLKSDEMIDLLLEAQCDLEIHLWLLPYQHPSLLHGSDRFRRDRPQSELDLLGYPQLLFMTYLTPTTAQRNNTTINTESTTEISVVPALPARTKKAKELQKKLGVGRPVAAGGTGARAVTRSTTVSRERSRGNRNIHQVEATIQEEPESESLDADKRQATVPPTPGSSKLQINAGSATVETSTSVPDFQRLLSEIVKPLQDQIDTLRAEVKRLQSLETEVKTLGAIVKQAGSRQNSNTARSLETTFDTRSRSLYSAEPSTPPPIPNAQLPSYPQPLMPSPHITTQIGVAPVLLGKRQRDSSSSESPSEDHQGTPHSTSSPVKKRPKLSGESSTDKGKGIAGEENEGDVVNARPRATSLVVYNDPEGETPPPNNRLPDYYISRSNGPQGSPGQGRPTSSANAPENQHPFNFSLLPEPSTPGPTLFLPAFPYPEPPQSPTPAGTSLAGGLSSKNDRSDVFKTFGLPPPDRAGRLPPGSTSNAADPAMLSRSTGKHHQPSKEDSPTAFGLAPSTSADPDRSSEKLSPGVKKTMYGTELEGDTRFGDFGVEGVAMGFWTGGRF
ncbi:hypothetical protein NP233_g3658 [Leucocoprinus birnbaumii]|uniref:Uncharacterized protein n=1 Tax=Leucocoprinus birnbaumii TaxID=56174 RepID=A0AAD5YW91_9AGAR|nr:hypothetical protein NP233_g3658 [Leucocoprinus birnbaumii]